MLRRSILAIAATVLLFLLAACGLVGMPAPAGEETAAGVIPTVRFTATDFAYEGPSTIAGGLTRIELVNAGAQEHMLWVVKLEEGKSFEDFMGVLMAEESDSAIPDWLHFYGGVTADPGQTVAYIVALEPGSYALFSFSEDENGEPDVAKGMVADLTVTEATGMQADPPRADLRAQLVDFNFVIEGEPRAGRQIVEVSNTGMEPHELILLDLDEGVSVQDAMDVMMLEEAPAGPPPFAFAGGAGPMMPGMTIWYEMDLEGGDYGLICFVPSLANEGAPHFMLGMVGQISVDDPPARLQDLALGSLGYVIDVPADWTVSTCADGSAAAAASAADLEAWCASGTLTPSELAVGVDVVALDWLRAAGLDGNPSSLDDLLAFNRMFLGFAETEITEVVLFGAPALRAQVRYDDGTSEVLYMGFYEEQVYLLGFTAPDASTLQAHAKMIENVIASLRPAG